MFRIVFSLLGTIFLVRHAERAGGMSQDPPLTERGQRRADVLSRMLADAGVSAIYASEVRRTQQTAAPLAQKIGKQVTIVPANDISGLVRRLKALGSDAVVLVVGHSNTVPQIVSELGGSTPAISENEYDRMVILVTHGQDKPSVVTLRYGD